MYSFVKIIENQLIMKIKLITTLTITLLLVSCTETSATNIDKKVETKVNDITTQTNEVDSKFENTIISDTLSIIVNDSVTATEVNTPTINQTTEENSNQSLEDNSNSTPKEETNISEVIETVKEEITKPNHSVWNELLKQNVSSVGKVNYKVLKNEKSKIENYINQLTTFTTQTNWSKNEKLAYWINLYNAVTVKLILDNYPIKSITDLYGGKPWDKKLVTIGSKSYSLNNIENDIIRPKFNDARIHFAVNCAAKSCPKLMNGAFLPEKLSYQLNKQAKTFINGPKNNITKNAITISKIFEWYKDDFKHSDLIAFLNQYSNTQINPNASISFNEYDWNLNE
jgi:hypothetical protein